MCKTCGLVVSNLRANRGWHKDFPQTQRTHEDVHMEKPSFILTLHNFYTHISAQGFRIFQSVIGNLYTFYTRLIITKTMYI